MIIMVIIKTPVNSETYAEVFQASTMESFWKIVNN